MLVCVCAVVGGVAESAVCWRCTVYLWVGIGHGSRMSGSRVSSLSLFIGCCVWVDSLVICCVCCVSVFWLVFCGVSWFLSCLLCVVIGCVLF